MPPASPTLLRFSYHYRADFGLPNICPVSILRARSISFQVPGRCAFFALLEVSFTSHFSRAVRNRACRQGCNAWLFQSYLWECDVKLTSSRAKKRKTDQELEKIPPCSHIETGEIVWEARKSAPVGGKRTQECCDGRSILFYGDQAEM